MGVCFVLPLSMFDSSGVLSLTILELGVCSFVSSLCLALHCEAVLLFGNDVFLFIKLMCFEGLT